MFLIILMIISFVFNVCFSIVVIQLYGRIIHLEIEIEECKYIANTSELSSQGFETKLKNIVNNLYLLVLANKKEFLSKKQNNGSTNN